ncbi:organic cation transporter -like [Paramuricea clavata]|uniref:Organic cation transporter -like n=1 Tax=Paramuricea clavata TaxID=317549 RepID=A0A6S7ISL9_PARCT|nr:organic cation transporter -like [Paramuricea clavata]
MNKKKILDDDLERPVILEQRSSFTQLFSSWKVAKTTLISWDLWFTNTLVYYGVSFGSVDLGGNRYLNFFLISLVGIPANVAIMWAANRFGRKTSVLIGLVITVIASAISVSIPSDQSSAGVGGRITAAIVANFFISFSFAGVYLWTSELFPTVIRYSQIIIGYIYAPVSRTLLGELGLGIGF